MVRAVRLAPLPPSTPQTTIAWKNRPKAILTLFGAGTIADRAGNQLDGNGNGQPGGDFVRRLSQGVLLQPVSALASVIDELLVSARL